MALNGKKPILSNKERIKVPNFDESSGFVTTPKLSLAMSKIRATNTKAELVLRKAVWQSGLRYRLHSNEIPGKPDLVFASRKIVVFIDGDFWHGYRWHERKPKIKSNKDYWIPKIERNMQRDIEITQQLTQQGWFVIRIWENDIKKDLAACVYRIRKAYHQK
jgi:DNA mismatch endonuclease (patch repair protein)